ncbi:MAG: amino acid ABC transporter permease [Acidimicrobiia bacterium]|nr:amino acid ABC transporter permease [Acidimicrobiia bacterium]
MSDHASTIQTAEEIEHQLMVAAAEADAFHGQKLPPGEWIKKNLFNNTLNTIITLVFAPLALYLLYRTVRYVLVTGQWEPVRANLELFMIGTFDREERWRVVAQLVLMALSGGLVAGLLKAQARDRAAESGEPVTATSWQTYLSSYWSIGLLVVATLAAFTRTISPALITIGAIALAAVGWLATSRFGKSIQPYGWSLAALVGVASFQVLSGTGGYAWFFVTLALYPALSAVVRLVPPGMLMGVGGLGALVGVVNMAIRPGLLAGIFLVLGLYAAYSVYRGDRLDGARLGLVMFAGFVAYYVLQAIGFEGIDWSAWSGFHINLIVAGAAIILAFPLGILLALGRRSTLPAIRLMSVAYIEFFRGAPLITFLLAGQFFLGFFLNTDEVPSSITRAIAAITLFSGAYVAEIIRGGLQAVPSGQTEAGQALGMSAPSIMRLLVLPQALRAVIPAMVGQFISLFKDTTLLFIIGITEFLGVRALIHGQANFRSLGIAETMAYVAFVFWAFAFAMSRESQRLERRLAVGDR